MKFSTRPLVFVGLAIFAYIVYSVGLEKIINILTKVDPFYLSISLLFPLPTIILKALRWKFIISYLNTDYNFLKSIKVWLIGSTLGIITPGHLGDFSRSFYLHRDTGMSLGKSFSTTVLDRFFDIAVLLVLSVFGIIYILITYSVSLFTPTIVVVFIFFGIFLLGVIKRKFISFLLKPFFNFLTPQKYKSSLIEGFNEFYKGLKIILEWRKFAVLSGLSIVSWFVSILQGLIILKAFGIDAPFLFLLSVFPIEVLISLLPITISGFGTRELTFIFFFSIIGVAADTVIAFSLISVFLIWAMVAVGFFFWYRNPIKIEL